MSRTCSKCGASAPWNPPNWVKLTESSLLSYSVSKCYNSGYLDSDPYWLLCPECYHKMFSNLKRYRDRTTTQVIDDTPTTYTISTADYRNEEPLKIDMSHYIPTYTINAERINKDSLEDGYTWNI